MVYSLGSVTLYEGMRKIASFCGTWLFPKTWSPFWKPLWLFGQDYGVQPSILRLRLLRSLCMDIAHLSCHGPSKQEQCG